MTIEKKFKMFSTREWIQFLQYKLSPEREKELEMQLEKDPFLQEAVVTIGDKENRALSYQSVSLLISEVQQYTGVSESKIARSKESVDVQTEVPVNWRLVGIIVGGALFLGILGYGIYHFLSSSPSETGEQPTMIEAESVSSIQSYADSSSLPMETIPSALPAASIPVDSSTIGTSKPALKKSVSKPSSGETKTSQESVSPTRSSNNSSSAANVAISQKERELFSQAQEMYKQGNREDAKKILRELKSYENPMKSQAETILKNMEN